MSQMAILIGIVSEGRHGFIGKRHLEAALAQFLLNRCAGSPTS